jgi:exopolyphosphatase/guanosine-5'-triphosphate,3'-diphosphate pyrophosphatase
LQVNQVELPAGQLHELADRLATLDLDARLALPGMQARRAPLLPIGAVMLSTLVEMLGLQRLVVSEWGLREGAVFGALSLRSERPSDQTVDGPVAPVFPAGFG